MNSQCRALENSGRNEWHAPEHTRPGAPPSVLGSDDSSFENWFLIDLTTEKCTASKLIRDVKCAVLKSSWGSVAMTCMFVMCFSGVYRSLQQSYNISSQDILMAMDYCEESLQEIDVTSFLQTLCGHIRVFRDHDKAPGWGGGNSKPSRSPATFIIGGDKEEQSDDKAAVASSCRWS